MKSLSRHLAAGAAALALPLAAQALEYDVRRIDLAGGEIGLTRLTDINARGQLIGYTAAGQIGILTGTQLNTLTLPGTGPAIDDFNDSGVALMHSAPDTRYARPHLYTYSDGGGLSEIPATRDQAFGMQSYASLSNAGHVVAYGALNSVDHVSLSQPDGSYSRLPFPSASSVTGVNSSGVVVGYVNGSGGAAYWSPTSGLQLLGTFGSSYAMFTQVTDSGLLLGSRSQLANGDPARPISFVLSLADGQTRFIDGLTYASQLDEAGRMYGRRGSDNGVLDNSQFTNLDALLDPMAAGDTANRLVDVASNGRILMTNGAGTVAYVLTPTPEPGSCVLMGIGLGAAAWGARRRQNAGDR